MDMKSILTAKQEAFALHFVENGNATAAYRDCYEVRPGTKESTLNRTAKSILDNPKVAARIAELRLPAAEKAMITLDQHLATLADLRDRAVQAGQMGAAISAEIARGKAAGLYVEKREIHARMTAVVEVGDDG